jgi:nitroimidazol reductase NimA-like FMN-containing flavoprotein (pyridoxamine 5'-phosphate oxidase superfamily)
MRIRELATEECAQILERSELGHLACARHGQPYIVPIHFSYDGAERCLYAFSGAGQKIQWMRENPKVCVEVEDIADKNHWTTVLIFGEYHEVGDTVDEAPRRKRALELFQARPEWWLPALGKSEKREPHPPVIYRIRIDRLTGRRADRWGGVRS